MVTGRHLHPIIGRHLPLRMIGMHLMIPIGRHHRHPLITGRDLRRPPPIPTGAATDGVVVTNTTMAMTGSIMPLILMHHRAVKVARLMEHGPLQRTNITNTTKTHGPPLPPGKSRPHHRTIPNTKIPTLGPVHPTGPTRKMNLHRHRPPGRVPIPVLHPRG